MWRESTPVMDKFKEKIGALRIEADSANARALEAEEQSKKLNQQLSQKDNEILSLSNKVSLLSKDLDNYSQNSKS